MVGVFPPPTGLPSFCGNLQRYGPEMASVCTGDSMLSEEDELGIDSLERLVDERLAAITNK